MNYNSKFPHGIMFHHFHNFKNFNKSQGSITSDQLENIIKFIGRDNILNAKDFFEKLKKKKLEKNHVCFTFDDGLKCQYEIALPVMKKYKIQAFWFIYSSIFNSNFDLLEIFREFRHSFKTIKHFYTNFFSYLNGYQILYSEKKLKIFIKKNLKKFPFYTFDDLKFRFLRDEILYDNYNSIMLKMIKEYKFDSKKIAKKIFMNKKNLNDLIKSNQVIGLHSHNHPTSLHKLSKKVIIKEYKSNKTNLNKIVSTNIYSMSHPCGNYNYHALRELNKLKIKIGFNSSMEKKSNIKLFSNLQIPRQDHANIIKII